MRPELEIEGAAHLGVDIGCAGMGFVRFALGAQAEHVDFVFDGGVAEVNAGEDKVAAHTDLLGDALLAGRDVELRLHLECAAHDGRLRFDGEVEEVANLAGGDIDVEIDDVAFAFDVDDGAGAGELRAAKGGRNGLQDRCRRWCRRRWRGSASSKAQDGLLYPG